MQRTLLLVAATALSLAPLAAQQTPYTPPSGPLPRMADGKPDLSGVWSPPYVPDMTKTGRNQTGVGELPFTEWGLAQWKSYDAAEGDYTGACLPFGTVRSINSPMPVQFIQNNKYLSMDFEVMNWFQIVPIDGRPHRKGEPTWAGDSAGHWDGDTLVIDTVNFNGKTRLDTIGHPAQRSAACDSALYSHRFRPYGARDHHRRSQNLHQAVEEYADVHSASGLGNHGVFVRGKQQEFVGRAHQGSEILKHVLCL